MKKILLWIVLFPLVTPAFAQEQTILGKWSTLDDDTGEIKSIVELYERNNQVYGKIIKIFPGPGEDPDPVCDECDKDDSRYKQKIIGMEIIKNMKKNGNEYSGGNVLDPENGKIYSCKIWLDGNDLRIRGYWGLFYRTQTWKRETP